MANAHGGARKGAGRPKKVNKHAGKIVRAEKQIADKLGSYVDEIHYLAVGGFEQVSISETEEPAGSILVDDYETIKTDLGSRSVKVKRPAFPDLEPTDMVVTRRVRTVSIAAPNLAALTYLVNRIVGMPTQKHEFASMTDEELIEAAKAAFGGDDEEGLESPESEADQTGSES